MSNFQSYFLRQTHVSRVGGETSDRVPGVDRLSDRPDGRGKNVTMIGAMSMSGIIAAMTFQGSTDTNAFNTYVTQVRNFFGIKERSLS